MAGSTRRDFRATRRVAFGLGAAGLIVVILIVQATSDDGASAPAPTAAATPPSAAQTTPRVEAPAPGSAPQAPAEPRQFVGEPIANGNALFDRQLLVEAGLPAQDAQRLRDRYEAYQVERIAQAERARREGRQQQIEAIVRGLEQQFRQELGDELYDYTIYGAGDFNRIRVQEVPAGSAAAAAGVEAGDLIRRYADQAVFTPVELVAVATRVPLGRRIPLQVERNAQLIDLQIDSGPLGAPLEPIRGAPGAR